MDNNKQHNPPKVDKEKLAMAKEVKKKALVTGQVINKKDHSDKNKLK